MAFFQRTQEIWTDVEMNITPEEFYEQCNDKEIKELVQILEEEGHLRTDRNIRSIVDEEWDILSDKLFQNHRALTREEEDVIKNILNRF